MRHVHSDIPAVEFASPLNAETQNTFTILTSGVSNVFTYSAREKNLAEIYVTYTPYKIRYSSCGIATLNRYDCLKRSRLTKDEQLKYINISDKQRKNRINILTNHFFGFYDT